MKNEKTNSVEQETPVREERTNKDRLDAIEGNLEKVSGQVQIAVDQLAGLMALLTQIKENANK